ncbi:hypothetical protein Y032_0047g1522 [Ancylostoma ceylanicum]|uniref:Peptidase M13 N-terminal domain-containing protein n=2 Tax=Ancylostoma ceylanicum TaxID=53326 RepID=A0A016UB29_9BILA|nr:hypothetical protein Y032_0047g1522 [Ancylostoma ceylanicum]
MPSSQVRMACGVYTTRFALLSAITFIKVYATTDVCEQQFFDVGNSTGYAKTTRTLENSIAFSADPCEDFYQFVCGNWIERVGETRTQITHFEAMWKSFKKEEEVMLHAEELRDSRAMASAQRFYEKCLTSDDEWKSKGGPITYVLQIIRNFAEGFTAVDVNGFEIKPLCHKRHEWSDLQIPHQRGNPPFKPWNPRDAEFAIPTRFVN